jgi:hypothetical protein
MRIEQQGHIEVQPTYQHVGYASAMVQWQFLGERVVGFSASFLGLGLVLLTAGLMCARRARASDAMRAGAVSFCFLGVIAVVCSVANIRHMPTLGAPYYQTLYNIEYACALTEQWEAELGRPPTPEEWASRMSGQTCRSDGWGEPLEYAVLPERCPCDGQRYVVFRSGWRRDGDDLRACFRAIDSSVLGRDGLFGTRDDAGMLRTPGDWREPGRYAHGREPRQ